MVFVREARERMKRPSKEGFIERRHHKMLVTQNTEYHLRDDVCVGMRSCSDGQWITGAKTLNARLVGAIGSLEDLGANRYSPPEVGKYLLFSTSDGEVIITTKLEQIERPPKEAVQHYVAPQDDSINSDMQSYYRGDQVS
jgi:hypothetical protein